MLEAPSDPVLDGEVSDLMDLMEAGPHRITINAFDRHDSGVRPWSDAPNVEIRNPGIPWAFDKLADFIFEMALMRVEQNARCVAHQRPGPDCDHRCAN